MINIGDKIFIPNYGAGIVLDIGLRSFQEIEKEYVIIYLIVDDMDLSIPVERIDTYKIRSIGNKIDVEEALKILGQTTDKLEMNWNKRYRKNNNKILSGRTIDMCEVLRDLYFLQEEEELPGGEEKILEKVKHLLASEIMLLYEISINEAYNRLKI
ncbi:MAG: BadM/Rrf2 family transcriptional regulator [Clostridiaceae bacterium]|nr:BadM/Rrf2 family transcriptional regulator [Clostridiaceae bacterium]